MKPLLKIKFSGGRRLRVQVRVRAVRLPARPGLPPRPLVLVILPDGNVVRLPEPAAFASNDQPRRGLSGRAVPPPCSPVPGCALARRPCRGDSSLPAGPGRAPLPRR